MSIPIRIAITGYGNLGRGAEAAISQSPDLELVAVVTRRDPATVTPANPETPVVHLDDVADLQVLVDVMLCCGGSKEDLPVQGPLLASMFNIVDSYDTHARIPEYFASVDAPARDNNTTAVISTGWDPGLFSINRLIGEAILPEGATYSFWGRGLSQGHSDAVRRVDGVAAGVQYTNPTSDAVARARSGERPELTTREKHTRHCFVVLTDGADADEVEQAIVTMPDYFVDYDTTVTFIDADTLAAEHDAMPHGGVVIRSASTADGHDHTMQFSLELGHNPSFTAGVVVAYARAAHRMNQGGDFGAKTPFDVAPGLLSPRSPEDLRRDLL
ncbi:MULTISPECIES: diaminopimelate dehydrogenase [Candidatus Microthrix]|uniref:diaminopimelate dehydrogenase n=1 Tax=Candidatus Neomicrothrix TaxID=41949 RepID=UPI0004B9FB20|nr:MULTISPECIES: diaminopimelate dehydrogenase [Microthrix]MBK7323064.1 diaminopimelate dehydrogenase [Candidatus Microthrix sp.]MBL0206254.1 diaminopimelate dehydrogenase [Candidatus Microthrix sp.]MBP6136227.1 diaminopimelate dehydrogenase [Candidatus Microthrix sp.]MBP6151156.1 diaminopimelate dehydrogenase [Candidatus Microthrix sp.]MBP7853855.1 diaminopimelate dehydrogenase [Candidatus Microthrix sp.]